MVGEIFRDLTKGSKDDAHEEYSWGSLLAGKRLPFAQEYVLFSPVGSSREPTTAYDIFSFFFPGGENAKAKVMFVVALGS